MKEYAVDVAKLRKIFFWIILSLLVLNIAVMFSKYFLGHGRLFGFVWLFKLDGEKNVPAIFSTLLILANSYLFYLLYKHGMAQPKAGRWKALAIIFVFLALDEFISIHEQLVSPMRELIDASGYLYFAWVVPYMALLVLLAIFMIPLFMSMERKHLIMYIISGSIFVSGAVLVELFEGRHFELYGADVWFAAYTTLEEVLEIIGMTLCMFTSINYLHREMVVVDLRLVKVYK